MIGSKLSRLIAVALLFLATAIAQEKPVETGSAANNQPATSKPSAMAPKIRLGPGDLLDLTVFNVPELTLKVRISNSGTVSLPLLGEMKLAGMTPDEAQGMIARELVDKQLVKHPEVSIFVEEYATQGVTVIGEVTAPGIYPLLGPHRLYDALSAAGGLTTKAGRLVTVTHKNDPSHPIDLYLDRELSDPKANIDLEPGDTIAVSKTGVVYVVGEVLKPGGFLMENNTRITLLQAIALAQGVTKVADLKDASIVRRTPDGLVQLPVRLDKVMQAQNVDVMLQADDILFVPTSRSKTAWKRGIDAIIAAATGVAIYGSSRL